MDMLIVENIDELNYVKDKYSANLNVKNYQGEKLAIFGVTYCRIHCDTCKGNCFYRYKVVYIKNIMRKEKLKRILCQR